MTIKECISFGAKELKNADIEEAEFDALSLLAFVLDENVNLVRLNGFDNVSEDKLATYKEVIARRSNHVPLQHITGIQNFYGYDFIVNENVLVPRFDTENLIEKVLELPFGENVNVLDMCTGSGCIAITLYKEMIKTRKVNVVATDLSIDALLVARENAKKLEAKIKFLQGDLFSALKCNNSSEKNDDISYNSLMEYPTQFDIIVSNPPYIPTKDIEELESEVKLHDPFMALDGDVDGLKFYRNIIKGAKEYLLENGYLAFEIGFDQALAVTELMNHEGFCEVETYKDLAGLDRVVIGHL